MFETGWLSSTSDDARAPSGLAGLVAGFDWSRTALGDRADWDPAIRATVELLLASPMPMTLSYGEDFVLLYNDAYADLLGALHPGALGRPMAESFGAPSGAPGLSHLIDEVYHSGKALLDAETQVLVPRGEGGRPEPAFLTRGNSVVRDANGTVVGVLTVAAETTQVTRRLQSLGELTAKLAGALTIDDVARVVLTYALASFDADHSVFAVDDGTGYRYVRRIHGENPGRS